MMEQTPQQVWRRGRRYMGAVPFPTLTPLKDSPLAQKDSQASSSWLHLGSNAVCSPSPGPQPASQRPIEATPSPLNVVSAVKPAGRSPLWPSYRTLGAANKQQQVEKTTAVVLEPLDLPSVPSSPAHTESSSDKTPSSQAASTAAMQEADSPPVELCLPYGRGGSESLQIETASTSEPAFALSGFSRPLSRLANGTSSRQGPGWKVPLNATRAPKGYAGKGSRAGSSAILTPLDQQGSSALHSPLNHPTNVAEADDKNSNCKDGALRALQRALASLGIAPLIELPIPPDSPTSRPAPLRQSREQIKECLELLKNLQGQAAVLAASSQDANLSVEEGQEGEAASSLRYSDSLEPAASGLHGLADAAISGRKARLALKGMIIGQTSTIGRSSLLEREFKKLQQLLNLQEEGHIFAQQVGL